MTDYNVENKKFGQLLLFFCLLLLISCLLNLFFGKVHFTVSDVIDVFFGRSKNTIAEQLILNYRIPKIITAALTGIALPVSGLLMQEFFNNPLAGPSVFGISSAAGLGVAFVIFCASMFGLSYLEENAWALIFGAFIAALTVMILLISIASTIKQSTTLIIIGFMISSFTGAIIGFLEYISPSEKIKNYIVWSFGSFTNLSWDKLAIYFGCVLIGIILSFLTLKPLQANQLGESYAQTMGVNVRKLRLMVLLSTALLTAVSTAFTGPIVFVGLAIPHLCRIILKTNNILQLYAGVVVLGMSCMVFFTFLTEIFPFGTLPINIITSLFGAPIIVSLILNNKNQSA